MIGFDLGLINLFSVVILRTILNDDSINLLELGYSLGFGLASGILSGMIVLGIMPIIEALGYVTNFSLLELADTEHPLLSRLMLEAPGTHHHSLVIGQLAEAGADSIDANSLLVKVACLYHDVGKIEKAIYFAENQQVKGRNDAKRLPGAGDRAGDSEADGASPKCGRRASRIAGSGCGWLTTGRWT